MIDYLWGHPAELIIQSLLSSGLGMPDRAVRFVSVGDMAGENISLPSGILRSSSLEILGSGLGSFSQSDWKTFNAQLLPELFQLAADNKLIIETQTEKLSDIESAWNQRMDDGKRLVISMT